MDEQKAKELGIYIDEDGDIYHPTEYLDAQPGPQKACLDGFFSAEELEAIAYLMRQGVEYE